MTLRRTSARRAPSRVRVAAVAVVATLVAAPLTAQSVPGGRYPLASTDGLRLNNVTAQALTHAGKRGVRLTIADSARRQAEGLPIEQQTAIETLAVIEGSDFTDGVIEAEIAGAPGTGAALGARGFVGIAFHVQPDAKTYDAFYLRPTNGRADDQERRNHAAQYISHPAWTWDRFRRETPSRYEAYLDLVPDAWTKVRIEVRGTEARLYVHGQAQPTLVVHDLKTGDGARGAVALWINPGTVAHFRDVRVSR